MKTLFTTFSVALLIGSNAFAQTSKLNKDTSFYAKTPLYIIKLADGREAISDVYVLSLIDKKNIDSLSVLNNEQAVRKYHERGNYGVIIIKLKKGANMLTLTQLFQKYKIKKNDRMLPLCVDSNLVYNAGTSLYASHKIKKVVIANDALTGKKYLKILTDYVQVKPDPNVVRIR
jgi:hypothetical protein